MSVRYIVGDTRAETRNLPDSSVHLVACSPPFIALRSYLPDDHPMKDAEIGSEPDPATFLDTLLALTAEWGRVLAPWGSIAIELGDTYAGSGGAGGDYSEGGLRQGQNGFTGSARRDRAVQPRQWSGGVGWPRPKCLALVPQAYALSLAYGRNVLTGAESPAGQWLVRNMVVWHRPNPAVGALGDKYRPSTSYITIATRSGRRWFDLDAVRRPSDYDRPNLRGLGSGPKDADMRGPGRNTSDHTTNPAGAPPLDCWFDEHDTWTITTQPSKLAHYAMWPPSLAERLVLSMCPAEVCSVCGEPRRRLTRSGMVAVPMTRVVGAASASRGISGGDSGNPDKLRPTTTTTTAVGWSDCGHDAYTPGVVLDPFAGTGTTLAVADLHGRDAIGIDIDERNHDLYPARHAEVAKALFGTKAEMPGQIDLFGGVA